MMLLNKHITKQQLPFDVLFLAKLFSKYICLEITIKLPSPAASRGRGLKKKINY